MAITGNVLAEIFSVPPSIAAKVLSGPSCAAITATALARSSAEPPPIAIRPVRAAGEEKLGCRAYGRFVGIAGRFVIDARDLVADERANPLYHPKRRNRLVADNQRSVDFCQCKLVCQKFERTISELDTGDVVYPVARLTSQIRRKRPLPAL